MSLEFLTNDNPPPARSILQYDVQPGTVYVSTETESMYANLTITVYNPDDLPVNCMQFQLGFMADAGGDALTTANDIANITPFSDQNTWALSSAGWDSAKPNRYLYNFEPAGIDEYLPLNANQSLVFHLNQVKIVTGESVAPFTIFETTGTSKSREHQVIGSIPIEKMIGSLSISSFDVSPPEPIIPGTPITLSWEITGADQWRVYDVGAATVIYDSTMPGRQNLMSWPVAPKQLTPARDTFYLLVARSGELFNNRVAAAMIMAAHFVDAPNAEPPIINPRGTSMLHWTTKWASQITITAPGLRTAQFNAPPGQYDIFPDAPGNQFEVQPNYTVPYTLEVSGPGNSQDTQQVMVAVNLPPPSIREFKISTNPPVSGIGQQLTLSWQSLYGYNATLEQNIRGAKSITNLQDVPLNAESFPVTPTAICDFILTVYGDHEASAEVTGIEFAAAPQVGQNPDPLLFDGKYLWVGNLNDLTVTKLQADNNSVVGTYLVPYAPTGFAHDGANLWVAYDLTSTGGFVNTVTRLRASDGNNNGNFKVGNGPMSIAFDGANIWVANSADNTVMKLNPEDGTILTSVDVGLAPIGLLFDGTYIWVVNNAANTVSKLALDGNTVIGTYQVGQTPSAMAFDGANVWVANQNDATVTKIRASDGAVLGTYAIAPQLSPTLTSIAFDGKDIWVGGYNPTSGYWMFVLNPEGSLRFNPIQLSVANSISFEPRTLCFDGSYIWASLAGATGYVLKL